MSITINERTSINWELSAQICNASRIDLIMRNALSSGRLGEIFQGRQEGLFFIHPFGFAKIADRQTYAPRKPNFWPAMLASAKIWPILPQMETVPEVFFWQKGLDIFCNIHDFVFPMLRLYQAWHSGDVNYREAICDEDLALALNMSALQDCYGGFRWNKLPSCLIYTVCHYERDLVCLPISVYQHPLYRVTLSVFELPCQPEPYRLSNVTNGDLFLTSDYAVALRNRQTFFIDQLGLESMNIQALRWRNLHWLLLDNKKEAYEEAIKFAAKARAEALNVDFIMIDDNGNETARLTIPELVEQSNFSIFELPVILRPQQLGMINLFHDRSRGMFLTPILNNSGFTKILCDPLNTIFHVSGIIVRSLTNGETEVHGWLQDTPPRRTLFLITKCYRKLAAKHCQGCMENRLFVYDIACVTGVKGNEAIQTIIRENNPEIVVILATQDSLSRLDSVIANLRAKELPLIILVPASFAGIPLFDSADAQISATCITETPITIVIKQDGKCQTLTLESEGWICKKSEECEIQKANRDTDLRKTAAEIEVIDQMPSPENLI